MESLFSTHVCNLSEDPSEASNIQIHDLSNNVNILPTDMIIMINDIRIVSKHLPYHQDIPPGVATAILPHWNSNRKAPSRPLQHHICRSNHGHMTATDTFTDDLT